MYAVCGVLPIGSLDIWLDCLPTKRFALLCLCWQVGAKYKLSWACLVVFDKHLICNVSVAHFLEKNALLHIAYHLACAGCMDCD